MKVKLFFAWYDFWVGFYWDRDKRALYVAPLPCIVFKVDGLFTSKRGRWRCLVRVVNVLGSGNIVVIIPSWNPHKAMSLPVSSLPVELREQVVPGTRLTAIVNLGATKTEDIEISGFQAESDNTTTT